MIRKTDQAQLDAAKSLLTHNDEKLTELACKMLAALQQSDKSRGQLTDKVLEIIKSANIGHRFYTDNNCLFVVEKAPV